MTPGPALRDLLAPNPSPMTLDGTRTYIVGHQRPVVIDPGPDDDDHLAAILHALHGVTPIAILLTHGHPDHAAGAGRLARDSGAPLRSARGAVPQRLDGASIEQIEDGDEVGTDAGRIRVIATPGHTPDHLAFLWTGEQAPAGGALFVGDLMMGEGDTALVAPPEGNLRDYLASLDLVEALRPSVLHPSHGPSLDDPVGAIGRYRRHRQERLDQVRLALRENPDADVDRIVDVVYGADLDPRLRSAAAGSIAAMLQYLGDR